MINLTPEQISQLADDLEKREKKETEWLLSRGWTTTDDGWSKGDYKQDTISGAVNDELGILLREQGWIDIDVHKLHVKFEKGYGLERPYYAERDKGMPWQWWIHPISGKVYNFSDAAILAQYNTEHQLTGETQMIQESLGDTKLEKDDVLWIRHHWSQIDGKSQFKYVVDHIERNQ